MWRILQNQNRRSYNYLYSIFLWRSPSTSRTYVLVSYWLANSSHSIDTDSSGVIVISCHVNDVPSDKVHSQDRSVYHRLLVLAYYTRYRCITSARQSSPPSAFRYFTYGCRVCYEPHLKTYRRWRGHSSTRQQASDEEAIKKSKEVQ